MSDTCTLTKDQREGIVERCIDVVETTSYDWQCSTSKEHNAGITYWSDIIRAVGFPEKADKLDKDFMI